MGAHSYVLRERPIFRIVLENSDIVRVYQKRTSDRYRWDVYRAVRGYRGQEYRLHRYPQHQYLVPMGRYHRVPAVVVPKGGYHGTSTRYRHGGYHLVPVGLSTDG